jgi:eukaryotic translation initiation factor 2C
MLIARTYQRFISQEYFHSQYGIQIKHPNAVGVRLSPLSAANQVIVPIELCTLLPGQLYKKRLPVSITTDMVRFATLKLDERFAEIRGNQTRREIESPVSAPSFTTYDTLDLDSAA